MAFDYEDDETEPEMIRRLVEETGESAERLMLGLLFTLAEVHRRMWERVDDKQKWGILDDLIQMMAKEQRENAQRAEVCRLRGATDVVARVHASLAQMKSVAQNAWLEMLCITRTEVERGDAEEDGEWDGPADGTPPPFEGPGFMRLAE